MEANGKINRELYKTGRISELPTEERWSKTESSLYVLQCAADGAFYTTNVVHETDDANCRRRTLPPNLFIILPMLLKKTNGTTEHPHTTAQCLLGAALTTQHESEVSDSDHLLRH